jgi:predicted RecB family nuclease
MQRIDTALILSPSDLVAATACAHLVETERRRVLAGLPAPAVDDPQAALIGRRGLEHERQYLAKLQADGHQVVCMPVGLPSCMSALKDSAQQTQTAMASGAPYIYQAAFCEALWFGRADFLQRVEVPSPAWPWSYEVIDTKLARSAKASAVLQLTWYSLQVARIQGYMPQAMHVELGHGGRESFAPQDFAAYARTRCQALLAMVAAPAKTYPLPVPHCSICQKRAACEAQRRADDHLCQVAGLRADQAEKMAAAGVCTVAGLAAANVA